MALSYFGELIWPTWFTRLSCGGVCVLSICVNVYIVNCSRLLDNLLELVGEDPMTMRSYVSFQTDPQEIGFFCSLQYLMLLFSEEFFLWSRTSERLVIRRRRRALLCNVGHFRQFLHVSWIAVVCYFLQDRKCWEFSSSNQEALVMLNGAGKLWLQRWYYWWWCGLFYGKLSYNNFNNAGPEQVSCTEHCSRYLDCAVLPLVTANIFLQHLKWATGQKWRRGFKTPDFHTCHAIIIPVLNSWPFLRNRREQLRPAEWTAILAMVRRIH